MSKAWYFSQCYLHLLSSTYKKLTETEVQTIISDAIFTIQSLVKKYESVISKDEQNYILLMIKGYIIPLFYIVAKVHKNPPRVELFLQATAGF